MANKTSMVSMGSKKRRVEKEKHDDDDSLKSPFECLPPDVLHKVLCCVEHKDLKHLFSVSTTIREATLIARREYFSYNTPMKSAGFYSFGDTGNGNATKFEYDAPNAPFQQHRPCRARMDPKRLAGLSVALFPSPQRVAS